MDPAIIQPAYIALQDDTALRHKRNNIYILPLKTNIEGEFRGKKSQRKDKEDQIPICWTIKQLLDSATRQTYIFIHSKLMWNSPQARRILSNNSLLSCFHCVINVLL